MLAGDLLPTGRSVKSHRQSFLAIDAPEGGTDLVTLRLSVMSRCLGMRTTYTLAGLEMDLSRRVMLAAGRLVVLSLRRKRGAGCATTNLPGAENTYNLTHDDCCVEEGWRREVRMG